MSLYGERHFHLQAISRHYQQSQYEQDVRFPPGYYNLMTRPFFIQPLKRTHRSFCALKCTGDDAKRIGSRRVTRDALLFCSDQLLNNSNTTVNVDDGGNGKPAANSWKNARNWRWRRSSLIY